MTMIAGARKRRGLLYGVSVQFTVIGALIMREIHTRFGRENIGYLWILVEPALFIFGVVGIRAVLRSHGPLPGGSDLVSLMFTGYPPLVVWRQAVSRNLKALSSNSTLLSHRQVQPFDICIARCALDTASVLMATTACFGMLMLMGKIHAPVDWPWFLTGWAYHIWWAISSALIVCALSETTEIVDRVIHVLMYLVMPICGVFFMVSWLPPKLQHYALLLPSVNAYEMLRHGYYGNAVRTTWNMGYTSIVLLTMTFIGLALMKFARRRMVLG